MERAWIVLRLLSLFIDQFASALPFDFLLGELISPHAVETT